MPEEARSFEEIIRSREEAAKKKNFSKADRYDFRQTEKFTQDQEKFLRRVFGQFADLVMTQLGPLLQTRVQIDLISIKQRTYQSYLNSLPDPTTIMMFRLDPDARAMVSMDFSLSFALLDRLLGGKGQPLSEMRYFTDLEKAVITKPLLRFLEGYAEAWKEIREFKPQFVSIEFNPLAVHIAAPSETMVAVNFQAHIAQARGNIDLCVPFKHLKSSIPRASFDEFLLTKTTQAPPVQSVTPIFAKNLEAARVPLSVELGRVEIMFQDLLQIEAGDVIKLESEIGDPIKIQVNNRTKFLGRPGIKDGKISVQVTKVLTEGDEEFEE